MTVRIGSLFSGAGGLDLAVEEMFGATTVWHVENDPAASKVLAHRWPDIPNHNDITTTDWTTVEPVDIMCGGWPCQPFSLAGQRKGADDERALWPYVAGAVRMVRPRIVVLENVSAVLGPEFSRVANDLAETGYEFAWTCVRASDVGAPHRRERLFIVAIASGTAVRQPTRSSSAEETWPETGDRSGDHRGERATRNGRTAADSPCDGRHEGWPEPTGFVGGSDAALGGDGVCNLNEVAAHNLTIWGKYAPAIRRWETLTRPAPAPAEPNRNGNPRLSAAFSEWMMGWPAGWVTQVPGISRNDQLRIIGNGVVTACATAALEYLLTVAVAA